MKETTYCDGLEVTKEDAAILVVHHLEIAANLVATLDDQADFLVLKRLKEIRLREPAKLGCEVFMAALSGYYKKLDAEYSDDDNVN